MDMKTRCVCIVIRNQCLAFLNHLSQFAITSDKNLVPMANNKTRKLQVVIRVRPLMRRELKQNGRKVVNVVDANTIVFDPFQDEKNDSEFFDHEDKQNYENGRKNITMSFDQVFDCDASNLDIFCYAMQPLVLSVLEGYNCCAFVYGVTSAGKTYTMLGNESNPGITYLTMRELFNQIEHCNDQKFDVGISYVEVYNELVMDLLTKTGPLKLREVSKGVVIDGLTPKRVHNCDELVSLLSLGNHNRAQHPTDHNYRSSRSHAIFQVHICMTNKASQEKRLVKLSMIDLAGSERGSTSNYVQQRVKEGASINKSLLALGNCIEKLADGSKHVPYRDSNMTRILKDSLGGNCRTVIIANISPSVRTYNETYNTLKYASRAQQIRTATLTKTSLLKNLPKEYYIRNLEDKISETEELKERIKMLEYQLAYQAKSINSFEDVHTNLVELVKTIEILKRKIDHSYNDLLKNVTADKSKKMK